MHGSTTLALKHAVPLTPTAEPDSRRLVRGVAVGLLAASIGALYTVFARWGIGHGLQSPDLTVLRFGVAFTQPATVMVVAIRRAPNAAAI